MPMKLKKTMSFLNSKILNDNEAEITLYGDIGTDEYWSSITDKGFKNELDNLGDVSKIHLHINSPGGDVSAAIAIGNLLKNHKAETIAHIDGLAASAATIISSCCDKVIMPKNALFMIHNPWTVAWGDSQELSKTAEVLEKFKDSILETYIQKSNLSKEALSDLMNEESWLNAEEAKEYGFVDFIDGEELDLELSNKGALVINAMVFDISKFNIENVKNKVKGFINPQIAEVKNDKDDIGLPTNKTLDVVKADEDKNKVILDNMIKETEEVNVPLNANSDFKESDAKVLGVNANLIVKFMNKLKK